MWLNFLSVVVSAKVEASLSVLFSAFISGCSDGFFALFLRINNTAISRINTNPAIIYSMLSIVTPAPVTIFAVKYTDQLGNY